MFGKFFGGAVGWMFGGPIGAAVGVFIGHQFERQANKKARAAEEARDLFITSVFQAMGHVAKSDGRVSEQEISIARQLMDYMGLDGARQQLAVDAFMTGKQPDFRVDDTIIAFRRAYKSDLRATQQWLGLLFNLAYADGALHPQAQVRLVYIGQCLGLTRLQFEGLHAMFRAQRWAQQYKASQHWQGRARNTVDDDDTGAGWEQDTSYHDHSADRRPTTAVRSLVEAYHVLGVTKEADEDVVKLAYRRLIQQHHPDKWAAKAASAQEIAEATEVTRRITAAYEYIREAKGW